jgi:hypothetical protein
MWVFLLAILLQLTILTITVTTYAEKNTEMPREIKYVFEHPHGSGCDD